MEIYFARPNTICFLLVAALLVALQVPTSAGPGGKLSVLLKSFSNPSNKDLNGNCCEPSCRSCDYYLEICLKQSVSGSCLVSATTNTYHNTKHVVFGANEGFYRGGRNPLVWTFSLWKGSFLISVKAMDYDPLSSDDLIDGYEKTVTVIPSSWSSSKNWREISLGGNPSTTILQYTVQCHQDYYGPSCTRLCIARDDNIEGHYTCDKTTGHKVCRVGWYDASCKVYCMPYDDNTNGHYSCDPGTGRKICLKGWYGLTCKVHCVPKNNSLAGYKCDSRGRKVCLRNWYGKNKCSVYCKQIDGSRAGYRCDSNGARMCLQGWYGPLCDCKARNDSFQGYTCNITTGEKICLKGWFGDYCEIFCSPRNDSVGHYICQSGTGAKECLPNWYGENCTIYCRSRNDSIGQHECTANGSRLCARNWYGPNCTVHCASRNDHAGHFTCHPQTGRIICNPDWYGSSCTTHCVPHDSDSLGHYNCNKIDGGKMCLKNWHGAQCSIFCSPQDNSNGHYKCDKRNGSRICLDDWFGTECKTFCRTTNNSEGHYRCAKEDGTKICDQSWFGQNCTIYCTPRNDSQGHYVCDHHDGSKICHQDWFGRNCSMHCVPSNNSKGHYDCGSEDGTKICHQTWYGPNCSTNCIPKDDFAGHYSCDATDGSKVCYLHWYGPHCAAFCMAQNSSKGHYTCEEETGQKLCLKGWQGAACLQRITSTSHPSIRTPSSLPSFPTESKTTDHIIKTPFYPQTKMSTKESSIWSTESTEGDSPVEKESRKADKKGWLTSTRIGLITGGFALLLCICAVIMIAMISCRPRIRRVPYSRQKNETRRLSLERGSSGRVNPLADDILTQYEMNDMFFKVQQVSWTEDGSRQVDDHLVMYNNPLFAPRKQKPKCCTSDRQLKLDSDWNVVFDL